MLTASKCLPLLYLPIGLCLLLLAVGLRGRKPLSAYLAFAILWISSTPLIAQKLMSSLEDQFAYEADDHLPKAEAIFVFGGMMGIRDHLRTRMEWNECADRFSKAVSIYNSGRAPLIVFSGGASHYEGGPDEGELLRAEAQAQQIPPESLLLTGPTNNTEMEAEALRALISTYHWSTVLVVTSAYHMPRAMYLCRGSSARLVAVPVAFSSPDPQSGWAFHRLEYYLPQGEAIFMSERAIREYSGILFYWMRHAL